MHANTLPVSHAIECLESRIAPASVFAYTDIDGDHVKITSSVGNLAGAATFIGGGSNGQLATLDLSSSTFNGASITVSVTRAPGGDGLAAIGKILGGTHNFGTITIAGDLGGIVCGSDTAGTPAIKALNVRSLGEYGLATQNDAGDLVSALSGALGSLTVKNDVNQAYIDVGGTTGAIGKITIGGSLIGGSASGSGEIFSNSTIGAVKISGDIRGGSGTSSGYIHSVGNIASCTISGSIVGGSDNNSGEIKADGSIGAFAVGHDMQGRGGKYGGSVYCVGMASCTIGGSLLGGGQTGAGVISSTGPIGAIKIGHNLQGGTYASTGVIFSFGTVASCTISGSVIGGTANATGQINVSGNLGPVKIGHNLVGGSIYGIDTTVSQSGQIQSLASITSVTIGGSVRTGVDDSTAGSLLENASIGAAGDIGSITVKGSVTGSIGTGGDITTSIFSAAGQGPQKAGTDLAIGKITIGGDAQLWDAKAGYNFLNVAKNGNAQLGSVLIKGDLIASNIIAGVQDGGLPGFGDAGDTIIAGGTGLAHIASITIGGAIIGTPNAISPIDHFGLESHAIGALKISGVAIPITSPLSLSPITGNDVFVRTI